MRNKLIVIGLLLALSLQARELSWSWWPTGISDSVSAGRDSLSYDLELRAVASSGLFAPTWIQSLENGHVSASPYSGSLSAGIRKEAAQPSRWFDYDFAVELAGRVQQPVPEASYPTLHSYGTGYFRELYAHVRLYIFDITAGIKPQRYLTQDSALSTGSLLLSGNSQPLPRVTIGIEQWQPIPGCFGYAELKGGLTHAWMADNQFVSHGFIHHKWIGLRVGGRLPVNISYEFHHAAQWGGFSPVYGDLGNDWHSFRNAFLAQAGGSMRNDQQNAQGNHVGSQQIMLTGKWTGFEISAYWQNFLEDNVAIIGKGLNIADGLWGVSLKQTRWPFIQGVTYEFLNTTDQSGPWHDRDGLCYAGKDDYYQNSVYRNGWNYWWRSMGTPFITSPVYNTDGTIHTLNSRVRVHHLGVRGDIYGYRYRVLATYARNYGNDNSLRDPLNHNTALMLEVRKQVEKAWGLEFGLRVAADLGTQWGNQWGAMLTIQKKGLICNW